MKALFSLAVLLVAAHSASAAVYTGEIEKITEPVQIKLAAYSATEEMTGTISANMPEKKSLQITTNTTCQTQITAMPTGFHSTTNCQMQMGDKITQASGESDVSPDGKLLNIQMNTDNSAMQQPLETAKKAALDKSCITAKIVTGSKFCAFNIGNILDKLNMPQSKKPDISSTVLGWSNYQGRRVLVTSTNFDTTIELPKEVTLKFKAEGYNLIDPETGATLLGDSNMEAELPVNEQKLLMSISTTTKTTYK